LHAFPSIAQQRDPPPASVTSQLCEQHCVPTVHSVPRFKQGGGGVGVATGATVSCAGTLVVKGELAESVAVKVTVRVPTSAAPGVQRKVPLAGLPGVCVKLEPFGAFSTARLTVVPSGS
jgi:hypothetical protein